MALLPDREIIDAIRGHEHGNWFAYHITGILKHHTRGRLTVTPTTYGRPLTDVQRIAKLLLEFGCPLETHVGPKHPRRFVNLRPLQARTDVRVFLSLYGDRHATHPKA